MKRRDRMIIRIILALALLHSAVYGGLLPAVSVCAEEDVPEAGNVRQKAADPSFTEKEIPVFRETLSDETVGLRFYEDQPSVPYMGIAAYYSMMAPDAEMTVVNKGDGTYLLTNETGCAVADIYAETLSSDGISDFANLMILSQNGMPNVYLDGAPYLRYREAVYEPEKREVTFAFSDYDIDIRGDGRDVYFPLATLSDMFADLAYHYSCYNGVNVYINSDNLIPPADMRDRHYYDALAVTERPADLAEFAYHELCFAVDHFYGYTGLGYLTQYADLQNAGLDKALESIGKTGTFTKELLLSTDMADYITGLMRAHILISDGAHTSLAVRGDFTDLNPVLAEELEKREDPEQTGLIYYGDLYELEGLDDPDKGEDIPALFAFRGRLYDEGTTYYTFGNTAVCVLDSFNWIDRAGWKDYYTGGGLPALDSYAIVADAMNRAQADPDIRNFVLDLTVNGGGSPDALMGIMSLWLDKSELTADNVLEDQRRTARYEADRNLDGTIDAADADVKYDLNYAVLTSGLSFSCANFCSTIMKDNGILLLGHRSAGGACCILKYATADGFPIQMSSGLFRLVDKDGNIAEGAEPDIVLSPAAEDGSVDYSEMFGFEKIGKQMDEWYGEQKGRPADVE